MARMARAATRRLPLRDGSIVTEKPPLPPDA
jgi:hypothetical protein